MFYTGWEPGYSIMEGDISSAQAILIADMCPFIARNVHSVKHA